MPETILIVGGGGREHAITRELAASQQDPELYACAGNRNPGIDHLVTELTQLDTTDPAAVQEYATSIDATMAVIGPEAPLGAGVSDALSEAGIFTFGPSQAAARIETDKAYQRQFMAEHDIPGTPEFAVFDDPAGAAAYIDEYTGDLAVKPTGLTGGKGVRVTGEQVSKAEAKNYVRNSGYDRFVLEERLHGEEFTVQAIVANGEVRPFPAIQDHKRAYEGDEGPNTGGMGAYSATERTLPFMTAGDYKQAVEILQATVEALPAYTGILYGQFMLTADGPKVVEFNARFGDPEAINGLAVLDTDLLTVLQAARDGTSLPSLSFRDVATVCKYAVPAGYPTDPNAGARVTMTPETAAPATLVYASVDTREDSIYTTTSRSYAVLGTGPSITAAETVVSNAFERAGTDGLRVRADIGTEPVVQTRIDHMKTLNE